MSKGKNDSGKNKNDKNKNNDRDDDKSAGSKGHDHDDHGNGKGKGHDSHGNGNGNGHNHGSNPNSNDILLGSNGNDQINGGGGHDLIYGGRGQDILDGGSGWDWVLGGAGNDVLGYRMAENGGAVDLYHGGTGTDTLRLDLTGDEWARADVKADVARFVAWLEGEQGDADNEDCFDLNGFLFHTTGLAVWDVEKLELRVDGVIVVPGGDPDPDPVIVEPVDDAAAVSQGGTVSGNVLANDSISGAAMQSVALVAAPSGGSASIAADGTYTYTAGAGFNALAQGETALDSFTYELTAVGGASETASVIVTITGVNDAPTANADVASTLESQSLTLDLLANDTDVDHGAVLSIVAASTEAGQGSVSVTGDTVVFDPGSDFDHLGLGESATVTVDYAMRDQFNALSSSTATVTVVGENDGPLADPSKTVFVLAAGATPLNIQAPTDADGDALAITITQAMGIGVLRDGDGNVVTLGTALSSEQLESLTYTAAPGAVGTVSFVGYDVSDGNGGSAMSTVAIFNIGGPPALPGSVSGTLGLDTFDFNVLGAPPSVIAGFAVGEGGDVLDVSDLLVGYVPGTSVDSQFVSLAVVAGDTLLLVNADGVGADFIPVALLYGEAGLGVNQMVADGNLLLG